MATPSKEAEKDNPVYFSGDAKDFPSFKAEVQKLQDKYTSLSQEKDAKIAEVKASGLGLMKSVKTAAAKAGSDEL